MSLYDVTLVSCVWCCGLLVNSPRNTGNPLGSITQLAPSDTFFPVGDFERSRHQCVADIAPTTSVIEWNNKKVRNSSKKRWNKSEVKKRNSWKFLYLRVEMYDFHPTFSIEITENVLIGMRTQSIPRAYTEGRVWIHFWYVKGEMKIAYFYSEQSSNENSLLGQKLLNVWLNLQGTSRRGIPFVWHSLLVN